MVPTADPANDNCRGASRAFIPGLISWAPPFSMQALRTRHRPAMARNSNFLRFAVNQLCSSRFPIKIALISHLLNARVRLGGRDVNSRLARHRKWLAADFQSCASRKRSSSKNPWVRLRNEHLQLRRGTKEYTGPLEKTIGVDGPRWMLTAPNGHTYARDSRIQPDPCGTLFSTQARRPPDPGKSNPGLGN